MVQKTLPTPDGKTLPTPDGVAASALKTLRPPSGVEEFLVI